MTARPRSDRETWPAYPGEMAARIRGHDWAATPLGGIGSWSANLRTAVGIVLTTRQPAFLFWGPKHVCLYNDAYAAVLGPEKHPAILGAPAREAWLETWHVIGPQLQQVMSGGPSTWHENQLVPIVRHGRREDAYWTYSYSPVEDPEAPRGIGGVLLLCAETTQAVAQRRAEERLAAALRGGRLGIHDFDPRSGAIEWDAAAARLWGIPPDEVATYEMFVDGLHPDDVPRVDALTTRALDPAGEGRYEAEYRVIDRTDGTVRWIHADGDVVFENGEPVRLVGTVRDVTGRKQAEQQLRRSSDTFYRLIRDNPFGIYIVDADFKLREVSRGAERVFENVRPLLGRDFTEVMRSIWAGPFANEVIGHFRRTLKPASPMPPATRPSGDRTSTRSRPTTGGSNASASRTGATVSSATSTTSASGGTWSKPCATAPTGYSSPSTPPGSAPGTSTSPTTPPSARCATTRSSATASRSPYGARPSPSGTCSRRTSPPFARRSSAP